jgi:hypothetical protein
MKKIMLGLVAAFALAFVAAPVHAEEGAAGDAAKTEAPAKKGKKGKKGKKAEGDAAGGDTAGGDAAKK